MRMRRYLSFLFVICFLFLTGCDISSGIIMPSEKEYSPDPFLYLAEYQNLWKYRLLKPQLQECYGSVYTALTDTFDQDEEIQLSNNGVTGNEIGLRIKLPHELMSKEEAQQLYNSFFVDNPQFFYVSSSFSLEGYETNDVPSYTHIVLLYTMSAEERKVAKQQLDTTVAEWMSAMPQTADEYEIELYFHDRLTAHCQYNTAAALLPYTDSSTAYSAYGALVEGKAVCEGYSRAMQLLLYRAGMACTLVTGIALENNESHMWNMVTVNGRNYHLDVTWDDGEKPHHSYFNMSTEQLQLSHSIDEGQAGIDTCTEIADNYHIRNGTYLDTYKRQDIAQAIAINVESGKEQIELRLATDKFDNALLFLKNTTLTKQLINSYLLDHDRVMWDYTLDGKAQEHVLILSKKI